MKNITPLLDNIYAPYKALLFYSSKAEGGHYVESYDMDQLGRPINAHPLSVKESAKLAEALSVSTKTASAFLKPEGLISENVLYVDTHGVGCVMWYTKPRKAYLHFRKELGITGGQASMPALLWRASRSGLWLWALAGQSRPELNSLLYYAPFFNCYGDGRVCMGNVEVNFEAGCSLEKFIMGWEKFYFGSAFSHLLTDRSPVKGNIVQLWKSLIENETPFPLNALKKTDRKLKDLLP